MMREIKNPPTNIAGYDPLRTAGDCIWDGVEAARAVDFFSCALRFVEGKWAGKPFILSPWSADFVATLYGWKRADKDRTRRYREACMFVPRKNAKTTISAGLSLLGLAGDGEVGAQIYTAAYSRDQASLIYAPAAKMVENSPLLRKRLKCIDSVKRITYQQTNSFLRSIPAEAANSHGFNAHQVFFDELHTQRNRDLYDVLKSSMGARKQPLFVSMSTAGFDRHSICYEVWNMARQIRDGVLDNPHFLPCIYELPEGEPWDDEATWHKCNPNLGVSISLDFLREECQRAKDSPAYENTFRNLYLNQWVEQSVRWISMKKWGLGNNELPDLTGQPCWLGVDLSSNKDITAIVAAFPRGDGGFYLLCRFFIPADSAHTRDRMDGVPYSMWAKQGFCEFTSGDRIDQQAIRREINKLADVYSVQDIAIDPWNAEELIRQLRFDDGFDGRLEEHRPGMPSMAFPSKIFDTLMASGKLQHGDNPVLRWMAGNVALDFDRHENFRPCKKRSTERIDGIVAAVMAVGRAATQPAQSWYYSQNQVEIG